MKSKTKKPEDIKSSEEALEEILRILRVRTAIRTAGTRKKWEMQLISLAEQGLKVSPNTLKILL